MKFERYTDRELRITAMLYATRKDVVATVKKTGRLPDVIPLGGFPIAMRILIEQRGTDPQLTEVEKWFMMPLYVAGNFRAGECY